MLMELSFGLSALGTGLSFLSQRSAAKSAQRAGAIAGENAAREGTAQMQRAAQESVNRIQEAFQIERAADQQLTLLRERARITRGRLRSQAAQSGATVDGGSFTAVNDRVTELSQRDQLVTLYTAIEQSERKKTQSKNWLRAGERQFEKAFTNGVYARWSANQTATQIRTQSFATLINGASKLYSLSSSGSDNHSYTDSPYSVTPDAARRMEANI